jgi:hypothetical protein
MTLVAGMLKGKTVNAVDLNLLELKSVVRCLHTHTMSVKRARSYSDRPT